MKKIILTLYFIFSLLLIAMNPARSQGVFKKGDISVNAGFGLGLIGYAYPAYGSSGFPLPLTANVEFGITNHIGLAPYLGYLSRSYGSPGSMYKFSSFAFGGQANIHLSPIINNIFDQGINEDKVDYYARLIIGYESYSWNYEGGTLNTGYYNDHGRVVFGPVLGVRYMLIKHFGVYAEGGRGVFGWLTLGVSLKL